MLALFLAEAWKSGLSWLACWCWPCCCWVTCLLCPAALGEEKGVQEGFLCDCPLIVYGWYTLICCLCAGVTLGSSCISPNYMLGLSLKYFFQRHLFLALPLKALCSGMLFLLSYVTPVSVVTDAISILPVTLWCNLCPGFRSCLSWRLMHSSHSE